MELAGRTGLGVGVWFGVVELAGDGGVAAGIVYPVIIREECNVIHLYRDAIERGEAAAVGVECRR